MRYAQADGSPVAGYQPISSVIFTQVVSNDVCCSKGCDGPEFASLLGGCADVTETDAGVTYTPVKIDQEIEVFINMCVAVADIDVNYFLSTGDLACSLDNSVTYSTAFGDDFLVMEDCCASAVFNFLGDTFFEEDLDIFCNEEDEITDGSEVDYNDEANGGDGVCTMVDGSI